MLGKKKILILCALLVIYTIHEAEAVVGLGLVYALTPGAAVGGLVTGIIGVILGGVSIAVALDKLDLSGLGSTPEDEKKKKKKKEEEDKMKMMMMMNRQPMPMMKKTQEPVMMMTQKPMTMMNQNQQYQYGQSHRRYFQERRYKRDTTTDDVQKKIAVEKLQLESFLDKVYLKDTSQCLEKLICSISKRIELGVVVKPEENDILNVIRHNTLHGYMYKKMLVSEKVGRAGGNCEFLYSSCPLPASKMLFYIQESSRRIERSVH